MGRQGPLSGQKIGEQYLIGDLLGEGGFGAVYKGEHLRLRRPQAIKVLLERHFSNQEFRERFLREAQLLATLEHSHIVHVDDFWVEQDRAYLMMPFISGGTLQDILQQQQAQQKFLALEQIISYLEQICTSLDYAHQRGVVHLDLKPLNLLVHEDGRLLLSDFGLAHIMKQGVVQGGSSLRFGTPHYMAPEHFNGRPEKSSDLYSLGIIAYQMFASRLPYENAMPEAIIIQHLMEKLPSLQTFRPGLSQELETVLETALAKKPEQRYRTATEFLTNLKEAVAKPQPPVDLSNTMPNHGQEPQGKLVLGGFQDQRQPRRPYQYKPEQQQPIQQAPAWGPQQVQQPAWGQQAQQLPRRSPAQAKGIGYVRIEVGKETGRIYEIRKESLSIGRRRESDIFLEDLAVSGLHASLLNQGNGMYVLKEEGSANGTKVNGVLLPKYQTRLLQEGDRIEIGQTVLVFGYR